MSIGFIGAGSIRTSADVFGGDAGSRVDMSLQSVLTKYDQSKSDLDRLVVNARLGSFDITSRQHYGRYSAESTNGWAENWYSEYRAVLALRADALQKKLQSSYNRVLERSAYTKVNSNSDSIFAPYANRTINQADVTYRTPVSNTLIRDLAPSTLTGIGGTTETPIDWESLIRVGSAANTSLNPPIIATTGVVMPPATLAQQDAVVLAVTNYLALHPGLSQSQIQDLTDASIDLANGKITSTAGITPAAAKASADLLINSAGPPVLTSPLYIAVTDGLNSSNTAPPPPVVPPPQTIPGVTEPPFLPVANLGGTTVPADNGPAGTSTGSSYLQIRPGDDVKKQIPMFGVADFLSRIKETNSNAYDTLLQNNDALTALTKTVDDISNSFVGRQYSDIMGGNQYDAKYVVSSILPLFSIGAPAVPPLTLLTGVEAGFAAVSGSFVQVGSGNTGGVGFITPPTNALSPVGIGLGPDLHYGHQSSLAKIGGLPIIPTIGLVSAFAQLGPFPLAPPSPLSFYVGFVSNTSYDVFAKVMHDFLDAIKKPMVETLQSFAYATSSGTAMDSYASRGEYHLTNPGLKEQYKNMNISVLGIPIPLGDILTGVLDSVTSTNLFSSKIESNGDLTRVLDSGTSSKLLNGVDVKSSTLENVHGAQGAESRETETGAFLSTNSFLSQFEMSDMQSEYWVGTQQNEELINMDMNRAMLTAGQQMLTVATDAMMAASASPTAGPLERIGRLAVKTLLDGVIKSASSKTMFELMYGNHNTTGAVLSGIPIVKSTWKSQGYNYVEGDHKPFEGDSDFNYKPEVGALGSILNFMGGDESIFATSTPDAVLEGYANTRRYTKKLAGLGQTVESVNLADIAKASANPFADYGVGARAHAGNQHLTSGSDGGIWGGTPLGDINEVYVGTRKVHFTDLTSGFGEFSAANQDIGQATFSSLVTDTGTGGASTNNGLLATGGGISASQRVVSTDVKRYTGSDTRMYGKRYDPAAPINFETFNSGLYGGDAGNYYNSSGGSSSGAVDSKGNPVEGTGQGGANHYDRRNQYSLSFNTKADSTNKISLFGSQALNPTIGGFIKMQEIDKNKYDTALLKYENIDASTLGNKIIVLPVSDARPGSVITLDDIPFDIATGMPISPVTGLPFNPTNPATGLPYNSNTVLYPLDNTLMDSSDATGKKLLYKKVFSNKKEQRIVNMGAKDSKNQYFGASADESLNELNQTLYDHMHLRADGRNLSEINDYRDVFNSGLMKNIFISGQTYAPSGGGITSSIEIRYDPASGNKNIQKAAAGVLGTREAYDSSAADFDPYNTPFLNSSRGKATVYLNNYFAYKKRAANNKT